MKKPMLMKSVPKGRYRLEGNAEERDSTEYNLALGQKRAEIVRRVLVIMGMPNSELEVVSYGEEKPRAPVMKKNAGPRIVRRFCKKTVGHGYSD
ncbi:protein of unknown function [Georgfuchsia toluolica]|uniref:OmpA-like domain-containing protein n=1 Tax=Georgfuchsia toluolica TaxID=424218 RepID=A0A916J2Y4_9PROT|nr:OmpA family protein [Georgfuchsia toluolica]CAG4883744.1 protein of unknown function [Georgfuchsia toluolica]